MQTPADLTLMGDLNDLHNKEVTWSINRRNLSVGHQTMQLNFDGRAIRTHGVDGPYVLNNLILSSGSSARNFTICDMALDAYRTSMYNFTDFEVKT